VRRKQPLKTFDPKLVTVSGIAKLGRLAQDWKAELPMLIKLAPIVRLVSPEQPLNAEFPMLVMPFGIVAVLRKYFPAKAEFPILVTGNPFVVSGTVKVLLKEVQPVMVMAPLFVVKISCDCAVAGSANASISEALTTRTSREWGGENLCLRLASCIHNTSYPVYMPSQSVYLLNHELSSGVTKRRKLERRKLRSNLAGNLFI